MIKQNIIRFGQKIVSLMKKLIHAFWRCVLISWKFLMKNKRSAIVCLPIFLLLYYVIGSIVCEKIDKNTDFEVKQIDRGYMYVQAAADLIKREIDDHLFAPNLPFIFPVAVLDNMPSFQKGIIKQLQSTVHVSAAYTNDEFMKKADKLLSYPTNVWLFSKTKDFKIEPSSVAQYRKARRNLLKFNDEADYNKFLSDKVLAGIRQDLTDVQNLLENQIRSHKSKDADDVFYYAQGRLYAAYIVLKAVAKQSGADLLLILEPIKEALVLNPPYVKNGDLAAVSSPNHLLVLAYLSLKARSGVDEILKEKTNVD